LHLPRIFRSLFSRKQKDADLALELESHLAHEIDDNLARGMTGEEARRRAHVKLGNSLVIRDKVWAAHRIGWLEDLWRDLRYAARTLRKTPGFTTVALLVMALGIGANTSIYSLLDSLLWRSLPVADPASLVVLNWHAKSGQDSVMESMSGWTADDPKLGTISGIFPYPAFELFQKDNAVFSDVFAHCRNREVRRLNVVIGGQAETASGDLVSGSYFQGLGIVPAAGRLIIPYDDRAGAPSVAVVSHGFSEKHFGTTKAVGQAILINNLPFTVVGVAPPEFFGVDPSMAAEIYLPMHTNILLGAQIPFGFTPADYLDTHYYWVEVMARLRPGVTLAHAQSELASRFQQWVATTARNDQQRATLPALYLTEGSAGLDSLRRQFSKPLYVLMTLVGLILAIACSNVANLLLARAASRKREIALRMSEGAGRPRIIRQLLTESVLLAALGGALGVLLALWGTRPLATLLSPNNGQAGLHAELNWHVLGVASALTLLTGVFFGLAPALQSSKLDLLSALKETRAADGRPKGAWQVGISQILVVGQIAISLLMLVAAGLFVRTLSNLQSVNLGFNRENLLLFRLNARQTGHNDPEISEFYGTLRDRLAAIPGVREAGLAQGSLIRGENQMPISLPGLPVSDGTRYLAVGPHFLTTMQIPILAGRDVEDRDRPGSQPVVVISEEFARLNFPGQNPLGHHVFLWKDIHQKKLARDMEIIGVARNARYGSITEKTLPVVYISYNQGHPLPNEMMFALRTAGDPLTFVNSIRDIVHQSDPRLPVFDVNTQKAEIAEAIHQEVMLAELCSAFAILALAIACVGLYGTISYSVARRTGEIGIRMALGAQRGPVLWMVLRQVLVLAAVGLAISLPVALGTSKFVESLLFGMKPNDPLALALAVTILVIAALLAGGIPARRASRIDPMTALRHE
jgi:macrolide transport system ATP-binding/permease protein